MNTPHPDWRLRLDELCRDSLPYPWRCGGVSTNYHTLADFRVQYVALLDRLLTDGVAARLHQRLVQLNRVAQDGMKARASAGAASLRYCPTLERCLQEAQVQVEALQSGPGNETLPGRTWEQGNASLTEGLSSCVSS
jgi:hypothetical protein